MPFAGANTAETLDRILYMAMALLHLGRKNEAAYGIACAYAVMKKNELAIKWLQAVDDDGFPCYSLFENETCLDHRRKDQRFIALLAKLKERWESHRTKL